MQDNRVIDIISLVGLEGLFRALSREIDHGLKMPITLQDMEIILGLPKDGEVLVGPTGGGLESTVRGVAWFWSSNK